MVRGVAGFLSRLSVLSEQRVLCAVWGLVLCVQDGRWTPHTSGDHLCRVLTSPVSVWLGPPVKRTASNQTVF